MSTKIGCDGLVIAAITAPGTSSTPPTYATPVAAPGVMSININPNASQETLFADDGPMESASTLGKIEVEIKKNELAVSERALILGHTIDANGCLVSGDADVPPYVAIGFKTLKSSGKYRYVWLYKGKFMDPEDTNETKGDSVNYQPDTVKGQFVRLDMKYTLSGKSIRPWKIEIDEESSGADATTISGWFTAPKMPTATA